MLRARVFFLASLLALSSAVYSATSPQQTWQTLSSADGSMAEARHESGAVAVNGKLYLLGGRGTRSLEVYDPEEKSWTVLAPMPKELHHFQPVAVGNKIYVLGAFTCCYPNETLVPEVYSFDTQSVAWTIETSMPASRVRGSASTIVRDNVIYVLGGNTQGHNGGAVSWFDKFNPATLTWDTLPDAPNARDHFSGVLVNDYLVAASGRQTTQPNPFDNPVLTTDVYDFVTGAWSSESEIPTPRAGALAVAAGDEVIVAGGEINTSSVALDVVEAYNVYAGTWRSLQPLGTGRHSGGGVVLNGQFHVLAGSLNAGGAPETSLHEALDIDETKTNDFDGDGLSNNDERQLYGTNPTFADSDFDQLNDRLELETYKSNPLLVDTDGDKIDDGIEVNEWQTSPIKADTDSDGLHDYVEIVTHNTNPLTSDTDSDGISDSQEIHFYSTSPKNADTDADELSDYAEIFTHLTNPLLEDSDTDGVSDGAEIQAGLDPGNKDSDNDGIEDGAEIEAGLDPQDNDSDNDGIIDGEDDNPLGAQSNNETGSLSDSGGSGTALWLVVALVVGRLSRRH